MYYTRESYTNFLDTEINAQIRDFEQVVRTKALVLKSRGNVFVGKFQKLQDNGTAVFKVRNSDNMPRKNSFWTACYLTGEMGSFKNWSDYSWLDLRKDYQRDYSDAYCAWIAKATEEDFCLIGIKNLSIEFADVLQKEMPIIAFGPKDPPLQYLYNLKDIVADESIKNVNKVLDFDATDPLWNPTPLASDTDLPAILAGVFDKNNCVAIQGPPGTGKTLIAKAVAGEAHVPFYSLSGSDFVEMFVGVGASRVRDLFKQAQQSAPCIIFIDEIDAIGRSRDSRFGGNDEREQTLNQLLSEMDGFDSSKGLLVLGATNRPEILDPALLRPGRFDRRVIVDKPDLKGRVSILKVHSKDVRLDETVDFEEIALATSGAVGADLANMMNEAAINAVKNGRQAVSQKDLFEAVELVLVGKEKKDRILSKEERRIVSYHEVGHALVTALQKDAEPVQKITIVPRTMGALGYVMQVPEEEKFLNTKKELKAMLVVSLAGRAAEEIVFDTVTTGAANDIEQATRVARAMVTQYGMSDKFGLMGLETQENQYLTGRTVMNCGDATAAEIDTEVMKMLKEAYAEAKRLLSENRDVMDKIAAFLIEKETITGKEFMKIFREVKGIPEPEEGQKDDHSRMGGESAETVESAENGNRQPEMAAGSEQPAAEQVQNLVQDGNSVMPQDPEQKTAETQNGQQGSDNGQGPAEL